MTGFVDSGFGLMIQRARLMAREIYRAISKQATLKCDCPFMKFVLHLSYCSIKFWAGKAARP
jgi:hypothetical protein